MIRHTIGSTVVNVGCPSCAVRACIIRRGILLSHSCSAQQGSALPGLPSNEVTFVEMVARPIFCPPQFVWSDAHFGRGVGVRVRYK